MYFHIESSIPNVSKLNLHRNEAKWKYASNRWETTNKEKDNDHAACFQCLVKFGEPSEIQILELHSELPTEYNVSQDWQNTFLSWIWFSVSHCNTLGFFLETIEVVIIDIFV